MGEPKDALFEELAWAENRARWWASRLTGESASPTFDDLARELLQEAAQGALEAAARGWFDQPATLGVDRQARTLWAFCLRRAAIARTHAREIPADEEVLESETPESEPIEDALIAALDAPAGRGRVLRAALAIGSPVRRLLFLAEHLPDEVTRALVDEAARGVGRAKLARSAEETWCLLRRRLAELDPLLQPVQWRASLAAIVHFDGPLLPPPPDPRSREWRRAANSVDQALSRGRAEVAAFLLAGDAEAQEGAP